MTNRSAKDILRRHSLAPSKRFGQNFLINPGTAEAMVHRADLKPDDVVVEVGVGLAALTIPLAHRVRQVIGVEIDSGLVRYHGEENDLPDNVTLLHADILKVDFADLVRRSGGKLKIIANLPYSISNPFLFKLVENRNLLDWAVVMLQKEVAERLMAQPATKEYGIPTVLMASCARVRKIMLVKPAEFHPRPKIDSLVIRLDFLDRHGMARPISDDGVFRRVVRAAFAQRRKTLLNNLSAADFLRTPATKASRKEIAAALLEAAGLPTDERAENLCLADFIALANAVADQLDRQANDR